MQGALGLHLTINHGDTEAKTHRSVVESSYQTPMSLTSTLQQPADQSSAPDDHEDEIVDLDSPADTEENSGDESPPPRRKTTATRGRARSRATKATPASTRKRKSILADSSDDEDLTISDPPSTPPASTRAAPKQKAARKSDAHVKSHFFAKGSKGETDLTDMTDRASPKKAARGGKSARWRGRGRGRGKGKA
jgi:xeroderma pigmentosum group C-complementing protein